MVVVVGVVVSSPTLPSRGGNNHPHSHERPEDKKSSSPSDHPTPTTDARRRNPKTRNAGAIKRVMLPFLTLAIKVLVYPSRFLAHSSTLILMAILVWHPPSECTSHFHLRPLSRPNRTLRRTPDSLAHSLARVTISHSGSVLGLPSPTPWYCADSPRACAASPGGRRLTSRASPPPTIPTACETETASDQIGDAS